MMDTPFSVMTSEASDLDKIIKNLEFEDEQYVKEIEKESQHIEALEKVLTEKQVLLAQLQESIPSLDEDAKRYHKLFMGLRDNSESMKMTSNLISEHEEALKQKQKQVNEDILSEEQQYSQTLAQYQLIWDDYKSKYESFPMAKTLVKRKEELQCLENERKAIKLKMESLQRSIEQTKIKNQSKKPPFPTFNEFVVKLAELKLSTCELTKSVDHENLHHLDLTHKIKTEKDNIERMQEEIELKRKEEENLRQQLQAAEKRREEEKREKQEKERQEALIKQKQLEEKKHAEEASQRQQRNQASNLLQSRSYETPLLKSLREKQLREKVSLPRTNLLALTKLSLPLRQDGPHSQQPKVDRQHLRISKQNEPKPRVDSPMSSTVKTLLLPPPLTPSPSIARLSSKSTTSLSSTASPLLVSPHLVSLTSLHAPLSNAPSTLTKSCCTISSVDQQGTERTNDSFTYSIPLPQMSDKLPVSTPLSDMQKSPKRTMDDISLSPNTCTPSSDIQSNMRKQLDLMMSKSPGYTYAKPTVTSQAAKVDTCVKSPASSITNSSVPGRFMGSFFGAGDSNIVLDINKQSCSHDETTDTGITENVAGGFSFMSAGSSPENASGQVSDNFGCTISDSPPMKRSGNADFAAPFNFNCEVQSPNLSFGGFGGDGDNEDDSALSIFGNAVNDNQAGSNFTFSFGKDANDSSVIGGFNLFG